jgi:ubiquinone/menaquinone biosynthesis C-methylase UbiE
VAATDAGAVEAQRTTSAAASTKEASMLVTTVRPRVGTEIAPSTLDDESRLDFAEAARKLAVGEAEQRAREAAARRFAAWAERRGEPPGSVDEVRAALAGCAEVSIRDALLLSVQRQNWASVVATYDRQREALEAMLAEAEGQGPGRLELDPAFQLPSYYAGVEYHLQPGGYATDPLAGPIYHYGTKVFYAGRNDRDEAKVGLVAAVPAPADGIVRRVVDLACSAGQCTTALAQRFGDAEVTGIDVARPMLRYAHWRAVQLGVAVTFSEQAAEHLRFPDSSVDLVFASILFHEIPSSAADEVLDEVHRVLRPGGIFAVNDFTPAPEPFDAWFEYRRWFDCHANGEPYSVDFVHSHFAERLCQRFGDVRTVSANPFTTLWAATR